VRFLTNICSTDLEASKVFYTALLGLKVKFDSDWYIQLCAPSNDALELGVIQQTSELIPQEFQKHPTGVYLTFVVDDVDSVFEKASKLGAEIIQKPRNESYGQRRFLVKDPNGCLLDICSPY
jgi:predicted enzyme related to lactoylglutathione lyase